MAKGFFSFLGLQSDPVEAAIQTLQRSDDDSAVCAAIDSVKGACDRRLIQPLLSAARRARLDSYSRSQAIQALRMFPEPAVIQGLEELKKFTPEYGSDEDALLFIRTLVFTLCAMKIYQALSAAINVMTWNAALLQRHSGHLRVIMDSILSAEASLLSSITFDQVRDLSNQQDYRKEDHYYPRTDDDMVNPHLVTVTTLSFEKVRTKAYTELLKRSPSQPNPFIFRGGARAYTPERLVELCEWYSDDALYHLTGGHFEPWLAYIGRADLAGIAKLFHEDSESGPSCLKQFIMKMQERLSH